MSERDIDQALVVRVQQGDKKAFDLLVLKYQLRLSKLVSRFLRNQSDVPDVVQESFIKAYRALPNFRGESAFYTWLYRIAINTAKNHLVAQSRKNPVNTIEVQDAEDYGASEWLKEYSSPEREALATELESTIYQAIRDLPADLREAITLREIEGLSYEDIATVMDCPVGTVRSRIFRAREAIDVKLQPVLDDNSHHVSSSYG
ncbi:MAG: RNA polymerase sigma factor RpoE [Gammaproteobacteria bacterium]|nr:RNA polymerase sigma factor RpoE [Gammaproteobacteria bacterium]